jgi:hypothetical protein
VATASYDDSTSGLVPGDFVFPDLVGPNEEYVHVLAADPDNQTFDAIVTENRSASTRIRPTIWPTPVLNEGDDLAFRILAVRADNVPMRPGSRARTGPRGC